MDEQACPRCKTTKYRNPSLKLMVNVCGHTLCESCVDLLFLKGSGSCPECNVPLRRSNFRVQLFDDPIVEKELDIRRRILRDYNKKEEDFESLQDYNDYLEEVESIIFNLCHNIDIINTNKKIDQYKKENKEVIMRNKVKISKEEYELEEILEIEKQQQEVRQYALKEMEQETKKQKIREKEALIDELMSSCEDASKIVTDYVKLVEKNKEEKALMTPAVSQFSTGIKFSKSFEQAFLPVPRQEEGPLYIHTIPELINEGPKIPSAFDIENKGYAGHIRTEHAMERAGGYRSVIACQRALQEALQGLFHGS